MLNVIKQVVVAIMIVVLVVLAGYSAYAQYWSWGALKRQEQRLQAIEQKLEAKSEAKSEVKQPAAATQDDRQAQAAQPQKKQWGY